MRRIHSGEIVIDIEVMTDLPRDRTGEFSLHPSDDIISGNRRKGAVACIGVGRSAEMPDFGLKTERARAAPWLDRVAKSSARNSAAVS
jgi:hypothetical protein